MDCSLPGSSVHGDSPGKNSGVGCHDLLQGIFPTQGSYPGLLHCRQILYHRSLQEAQGLVGQDKETIISTITIVGNVKNSGVLANHLINPLVKGED